MLGIQNGQFYCAVVVIVGLFSLSFVNLGHTVQTATNSDTRSIGVTDTAANPSIVFSIPETDPYLYDGEGTYLDVARSMNPVTDKVAGHTYQIMYGLFLLPYYKKNSGMKMLEIGLGCQMFYGPGASARLHKQLFPLAELWEADVDAECVEKSTEQGFLEGYHVLVGDQGHVETLERWIIESGGNFDVIIDDGGHDNCQIWTSFLKLWPTVKKGGFYFIEDMQVAKMAPYQQTSSALCEKGMIVPENIKEMVDKLIFGPQPIQGDVKFVFCQWEACVIGKMDG